VLSIQLLGSPQISANGRPLTLTRRKSRAIVYYLAAHQHPLTRDHLLSFFWPDLDRPAAQQTLRTTLHGLRKTLNSALLVEENTLALDAEVDVRRFASSLQLPTSSLQPPTSNLQLLTSSLQLYRGDFLSGFTLPGTPEFDDWATVERERYRRLAVRGLTALARLHEAEGNFTAALDALDRALAFDALQEDLQRDSIRLLYLAGDRAGAIRRYDSLRKLLDAEMGMPPMAETRALYDSILNDTLQIPSPKTQLPITNYQPPATNVNRQTTNSLPFTGREAELQILRTASADHKLVLLEGEPGIGKTRLAEEYIHSTDAIALRGIARELEQALPYQPLIESLRGLLSRSDWPILRSGLQASLPKLWLTEVARLLPELSMMATASPAEAATAPEPAPSESFRRNAATLPSDESRLWEGVNQFLSALAAQHPVIVFLDDLHWADSSTLALLGYLARQPGPAPLTYLTAARQITPRSPLASLLQTLTRDDRLTRLPLHRLSADDIAAIAQTLSPTHAGQLAGWLTRFSEGNPYMLAELIREARQKNILYDDGGVNAQALQEATSPIVPQTIYSLIESRLSRLSDPARRVLDAAVAAGREFDFEVVARAVALSENAALDALDELRASNLIYANQDDPTGRLYIFDHTLTMEVAYRDVGEARHRLFHHRLAEALETIHRHRTDSVAGLIASHFIEGNAPDRAAPYAFRAGQLAAGLAAWAEAAAFYGQALTAEIDNTRRLTILLSLGDARLQSGAPARASESFQEAITLAGTLEDTEAEDAARIRLGRSLLTQGRYAEAIGLARKLINAARPESVLAAESLWGTALSLEGADLAGAAEHLQKAQALCQTVNDPNIQAQIKFDLGGIAAQQGDFKQAIALYREALEVAESEAIFPWQILARNNLAYHLHLLGDPAANEYAQAGLKLAQEKGILSLQTYLLSTLGEIALAANDLDTAEERFTEGLTLAERLSVPERIAGLTANLGLVAARRGQTGVAIHRLSTALAQADSLGTQHLAAQIRLWLIPLLPPTEARTMLAEARAIAESGNRRRLLAEVDRLEKEVGR
jgi:DNA-binding SARP family transcriptional activator/Flp pilus assembly protein TadD